MKILCYGDSNTYGYDPRSCFGGRYSSQNRWVDILEEKLGCTILNAGENGREIPWREAEMREFRKLIANSQPIDLLIIMLGTNDLLQGNPVEAVVSRMEGFLKSLDTETVDIFLLAPPLLRPGEWVFQQELMDASKRLNASYRDIADRLDIRFANAGEWNLKIAFDGVHLTQDDHITFAEDLYQYLKKENEKCYRQE